jgi:phosphoribosyl 1,2-cyclic phosphodiesterase
MRLNILGSGSSGNSYIFQNDSTALLIECGCSITKVKKALDFNIMKVAGAIVSHSHGDHAGKVNDVLKAGINVYVSEETNKEIKYTGHRLCLLLEEKKSTMIGDFKVMPFYVKHDVACFGFLIHHPECGKVLFITDTYYIPYNFTGLNQVLIEANYDINILNENVTSGRVNSFVRDRVVRSHMSIETAKHALKASDLSQVNNIVLIHLSDSNSNAVKFKKEVEESVGKSVHIADKEMVIDFNIGAF